MIRKECGIVVLISGRGSNLQSIIDATRSGELPVSILAVLSNKENAAGLERAREAGIPTEVVDPQGHGSRESFDEALMAAIDRHQPQLVVLAGFMRILGEAFVQHYTGRLINIHPALLPAFPGLDTHARALSSGAVEHGASVHFVIPEVDAGPIIIQRRVPVEPGDSPETLAARVLTQEHLIYPKAIRWFAEGRLTVENDRVLLDGSVSPEQGLAGAAPD